MRFTLICDDKKVRINGVLKKLPADFGFPPNIHAVQWYETYGDIEYKDKRSNERFTDLKQFQRFIDGFNAQE